MAHELDESNKRNDGDRSHWEIEKLRAETESLRRSAHLSPTTLVSVSTALVAILGAGFQYQLNQIRAERVRLEETQALSNLGELEKQKTELAATITEMLKENGTIALQLVNNREQLAKAEDRIQLATATAASAEAKQALARAKDTVATVETQTSESERLRAEHANRLDTIQEQISPAERSPRLYVGNLSFATREMELRDLFGRVGKVTSVSMALDRATGRSRGFAFVDMSSDAEAKQAIRQLNGSELNGRRLTINKARP